MYVYAEDTFRIESFETSCFQNKLCQNWDMAADIMSVEVPGMIITDGGWTNNNKSIKNKHTLREKTPKCIFVFAKNLAVKIFILFVWKYRYYFSRKPLFSWATTTGNLGDWYLLVMKINVETKKKKRFLEGMLLG